MDLLTRRALIRAGALAAAGLAGGGVALRFIGGGTDAIERRTLDELAGYTRWLSRNGVRGFIGEAGWPRDQPAWDRLAERWYEAVDKAGLPVTNWASGEWWGDYPLASYGAGEQGGTVDQARTQAAVIERHPSRATYIRGVNVAGGAFGFPAIDRTSRFSNRQPGMIDVDYHYDQPASLAFLALRGIRLVRIEFRWERIQPELGSRLDPAEVGRLRQIVKAADEQGLAVVLDMHNYAAYYRYSGGRGVRAPLGSSELPTRYLIDAWRRLGAEFRDESAVKVLGLMNEPAEMQARSDVEAARMWEAVSRETVAGMRAAGERRWIAVGGYGYSAVQRWPSLHPRAWIDDARILYEAHHYWDLDHDSTYELSYDDQLAVT